MFILHYTLWILINCVLSQQQLSESEAAEQLCILFDITKFTNNLQKILPLTKPRYKII